VDRSSSAPASRRLGREFFDRPTVAVARGLLGTTLRVGRRAVRIVETEAYVASDPASHAFRGRTPRNRSMFEGPGTLYVFRIHQVVCANLVTRPGQAVLLRAGEPLTPRLANTSGPGRLCRALEITLADDGVSVVSDPRISVESGAKVRHRIRTGPRVGIREATDRPLRFAIEDNRWVSRPSLRHGAARPLPRRSRSPEQRRRLPHRRSTG
jgi:DNA-3-methyladenine glycosylase